MRIALSTLGSLEGGSVRIAIGSDEMTPLTDSVVHYLVYQKYTWLTGVEDKWL